MKVAQYPAAAGLGNDVKEISVPAGTIETFGSSYTASRAQPANRSSLRDGPVLQHLTQHFVLGYFHRVPPGRLLPAHIPSRYVDAGWAKFL
jgi:hypothetical protein